MCRPITIQDILEVFANVAAGSTFKEESRRLGVGDDRLLGAARVYDTKRCDELIHASRVMNASYAARGHQKKINPPKTPMAPRLKPVSSPTTPKPGQPGVRPRTPAKRQHVFVDRSFDKRTASERAIAFAQARLQGMRILQDFTTDELAALQVKAEVVLNGHLGLNIGPTYQQTLGDA